MSYCSFFLVEFCISCSERKIKAGHSNAEFLEIFDHPCRPTEYTSPFLSILPGFGKRYLEEKCWQRGQSINQASGILKELCLISASNMIAKNLHTPWNNNKEHCPCYQMQNIEERVQPLKIWIKRISNLVKLFLYGRKI